MRQGAPTVICSPTMAPSLMARWMMASSIDPAYGGAVMVCIVNNVRKLITDEMPINPKYYERYSIGRRHRANRWRQPARTPAPIAPRW